MKRFVFLISLLLILSACAQVNQQTPIDSASGWSYEGQSGNGKLYSSRTQCGDGQPETVVAFSIQRQKATLLRDQCQTISTSGTTILDDSMLTLDPNCVNTGIYPDSIQVGANALYLIR